VCDAKISLGLPLKTKKPVENYKRKRMPTRKVKKKGKYGKLVNLLVYHTEGSIFQE
jgi:hypothetical protein